MDEDVSNFALSKVFPLIFLVAVFYFILSILYLVYYFFIRKNYRYIEDNTKEETCLLCTEANCSKKQNKYNISNDFFGPNVVYNEKIKIKSNLEIIEDHLNNLKPNIIEDNESINSTLNKDSKNSKKSKNSSKNTHKSSKSYLSSNSTDTYINIDDKAYNTSKSEKNSTYNDIKYGRYGSTKVYNGKVKSNKFIENEKKLNSYKSINKKDQKAYQNYVSFNNVFKERNKCTCDCHNKEYSKIRVKFDTLDFVSKNDHEFIYWSFYICLQITALMVILFGVFSVFPS